MNCRPRWAFIHPFQLRLRRGIEAYLWNLATALTQSGVDVEILTWQGRLKAPNGVHDNRVRLRVIPSVRYYQHLLAVPLYLQSLLHTTYDHIFVHFAGYGEGRTLNLLRYLKTVPFSVVFHFPQSLVPHRYREFEDWGYDVHAKHLIAVSQFVAEQVEAWSGRPCRAISHGVDAKRFQGYSQRRQRVRHSLHFRDNDYLLITVAALEARKGIQWMIKALPQILETHPNTHYLILGDGEYRQDLEGLIQSLNLQGHVQLLGSVPDVAPYLSAANMAILLSHGEAAPVALFEYAAAALPIITSPQPPFNELINPEWGQLVDGENTSDLADCITKLMAHPAKRVEMGQAARAWVKKNHTWEQVAQQYRELIG